MLNTTAFDGIQNLSDKRLLESISIKIETWPILALVGELGGHPCEALNTTSKYSS